MRPINTPFGLVVHGGSETVIDKNMTAAREQSLRDALTDALLVGYRILAGGGTSLDSVEAAMRVLEDCPLFNAGTGAELTGAGTIELDASIMDGRQLTAGSVAGVCRIRNPISLARLVMEESPHVMLVGAGAEAFARDRGVKTVSQNFHHTRERWLEFRKAKAKTKKKQEENVAPGEEEQRAIKKKCDGTVGAVALDQHGNLAAGTSTDGMSNRLCGRVSDSAVIAAGTYANNETCAVSATGYGEYFIRSVAAYDISALMQYKAMLLSEAADAVVMDKLVRRGGTGGVIAIDRAGHIAMPFNTPIMYRGYVVGNGEVVVRIFKD